jgi:hypothetical protein
MNRQQLIAKRNEVTDSLIAQGWDYDDARFAAMTAAAQPDGILGDQMTTAAPELVELAKMAKEAQSPAQRPSTGTRMNSTNEMEDQ